MYIKFHNNWKNSNKNIQYEALLLHITQAEMYTALGISNYSVHGVIEKATFCSLNLKY